MTKQWHGGKGSVQRPSEGTVYQDNWEKIFGKKKPEVKSRKKTPTHGVSQVHKDRTKTIPRKEKYDSTLD
jgi:hypothetical protein|tara:strand:- start:90 stop:299 length:210 start_codon:yes stop_codon:yes gene_type:complete